MQDIKIGLIGFGTIGKGVVKILLNSADSLKDKTGYNLILKKIVDIDIESDRGIDIDKRLLSDNADDILDDPEIDIVVELIGGLEPAKTFVTKALNNNKHVVTANKLMLSEHAYELLKLAKEKSRALYFEASVGGGIPLIRTLKEGLAANKIESIYGIINGTSNFILTKMSKENKSFEESLKQAQDMGFAESDPTFDIEGYDAVHKLSVLSSIAYGIPVKSSDIYVEGISSIEHVDMKFAHILNYEIKLLAIAKLYGNSLDLRVHPTLIPDNSIMANILYENNAVYFIGDKTGPVMMYGKGAGELPTASAVISDICVIAKNHNLDGNMVNQKVYYNPSDIQIVPRIALQTKYYLRVTTVDKPYVLSSITRILSDNQISVESLLQTEHLSDGSAVIVIMTHKSLEKSIIKAVKDINKLAIINDKTLVLRVDTLNE